MNEFQLGEAIENILVARNLRNMALARSALRSGYYLRAAQVLRDSCENQGNIIIGTGFPVAGSFETDGPVGAMALYTALVTLGAHPVIACGGQLADALSPRYDVLALLSQDLQSAQNEAGQHLKTLGPTAVIAIEHPGLAADGRYYNMHGQDISGTCSYFDPFVSLATCPTIAIGDGGNEIGMGNIADSLESTGVRVSTTRCDELLVADVSNWGAYGLVALLGMWSKRDLLASVSPRELLDFLCAQGGVDGVTGNNTPTEDGLPATEGLKILKELRASTGFTNN